MTKLQGSLFSLTLVGAFGYFVYRVFLKGRDGNLVFLVPTPIPGVEREVVIPHGRIP
jgi:hypothetical protein